MTQQPPIQCLYRHVPRSLSLTARGPSLLCEAELLAAHLGLASLDPGAATTTGLARVLGDKYGYRVD